MVLARKTFIFIMKMTLVVFVMWKYHLKVFLKILNDVIMKQIAIFTRDQMRLYMTELTCRSCQGYRLNPQALAVKKSMARTLVKSVN